MKTRVFLATASAASVLLFASAALAQNAAYITQTGNNNAFLADQDVGEGNLVGTDTTRARQLGDNNGMNIVQENRGSLGVPTGGLTAGVLQSGNRNVLDVFQQNSVTHQVQQIATTATATSNTLSITQTQFVGFSPVHWANSIDSVSQTQTGLGGGSSRNQATISQHRAFTGANPAHGQTIGSVTQNGAANQLTASQDGARNSIASMSQTGSGNRADVTQTGYWNGTGQATQSGDNNRLTLSLIGDRNGGLVNPTAGVNPEQFAGISHPSHDASIRQTGTDNRTDLIITGNSNGYAIYQNGDSNRAEGMFVTGDFNQIAIGQYFGNSNKIYLASIDGNRNLVGLRQGVRPIGFGNFNRIDGVVDGDDNIALVDQVGSFNATDFSQTGDFNDLRIVATGSSNTLNSLQSGDSNVATVNVTGSSNFLDATQNNTGLTGNTITANIYGNSNNASGAFSGDARSVADAGGLTRGELVQDGSGHNITLTVGTLAASADSNKFAFSQTAGANNSIVAEIYGSLNQVAVVQAGVSNVAQTIQTGGSNNIGILQ